MIEMKFAVDRIEEDIVILESIETGDIIEADKKMLPDDIREGSILVHKDDQFQLDIEEEISRKIDLMMRLEKLKKSKE